METFFISWAYPKEVAAEWYFYLGLLLLLSLPLVIELRFLKPFRNKLAFLLVLGAMSGFMILSTTDVGLAWPDLVSANIPHDVMTNVVEGEKVFFKYGCPNCHRINNFGMQAGPNLTGVSRKMGSEELSTFIMGYQSGDLHALMPKYQQSMSPRELELLLEFLSHL